MNSNSVLAQIRTHVSGANQENAVSEWHRTEAIHLFEALDAWLTAGGSLPDAWLSRTDIGLTEAQREAQGYTRAQ